MKRLSSRLTLISSVCFPHSATWYQSRQLNLAEVSNKLTLTIVSYYGTMQILPVKIDRDKCFHLHQPNIIANVRQRFPIRLPKQNIIWVKAKRGFCVGCRKRMWTKMKKKKAPNTSKGLRVIRTSFISPLVVLAACLSPFLRLEKSSQNTASSSRNKLFAHARVRWNSLERPEFSLCVSPGRNAHWDFQREPRTDLDIVC